MTKVIFFGNEVLASGCETSAPVLNSLIEAGYEVTHLILNQAEIKGRKKKQLTVETVANTHNIEVIKGGDFDEIQEIINQSGAKVGVLAAYGRIVPQRIIDAFEFGIINIHPSLLPKYRGSTPIESAILSGDDKTGVSIMKLAKEMDAGPILGFGELELTGNESKQEILANLSEIGSKLLIELLPAVINGSIQPIEQDHDSASFTKMIKKEDSVIDWTKPAEQIAREIRAYLGWPGSKTKIGDIEVIITDANSSESEELKPSKVEIIDNKLFIVCADGKLQINKLKPLGKQEMSAKAFINGYRDRI